MIKATAIHVLGVAHSIANGDYPTDPFTNKAMFFSKALYDAGYDVYFYGVEGSEVECTEVVPIVSKEAFYETYPTPDDTRKNHFADILGKAWEEYFKKGPEAVKSRIKDKTTEIILPFFGYPQADITNPSELLTIEPGIGHPGSFADFRIFESYAWQNFTYGKEGRDETSKWPTSYSAVIPNFYYPELYDFSEYKDDYFMFMGRVNWGKGISLAVEVANHFNKKIIIAGYGDIDQAIPEGVSKKNIEYVGILNLEEKVKYLSKATAFFCPSQYIEPFGHVVPEASLCGTPVISTDFGAFSETVLHGITGFRGRVFQDFIDAINNIHTIDPLTCRKSAVERFSIENILPKYYKFFSDALTLKLDQRGWYALN